MTPLFEGNPLIQEARKFVIKPRVFVAAHSGNFMILTFTVLIGLKSVTVGRTDTA